MDSDKILCPSSKCEEGSTLLGIVLPNGTVAYSSDTIVINKDFVEIARQGRDPEKRFRFSGVCVKGACAQWTGQRCSVIDEVMGALASEAKNQELPECSIRPQCRWYVQNGAEACKVCPFVITNLMTE